MTRRLRRVVGAASQAPYALLDALDRLDTAVRLATQPLDGALARRWLALRHRAVLAGACDELAGELAHHPLWRWQMAPASIALGEPRIARAIAERRPDLYWRDKVRLVSLLEQRLDALEPQPQGGGGRQRGGDGSTAATSAPHPRRPAEPASPAEQRQVGE